MIRHPVRSWQMFLGYLGASALSPSQIASYAAAAGFQGDDLTTAVAVALGESSGVVNAHNSLGNREDSWGLWQINRMAHPEYSVDFLITPDGNASAAYSTWQNAGGSWQPWGSFTNGSYAKFLPAAQQATQSYVAAQQPDGLNTIMPDGTVVDPQGNVVSTVAPGSSPGPAVAILTMAGVFLAVDYLFLRE